MVDYWEHAGKFICMPDIQNYYSFYDEYETMVYWWDNVGKYNSYPDVYDEIEFKVSSMVEWWNTFKTPYYCRYQIL